MFIISISQIYVFVEKSIGMNNPEEYIIKTIFIKYVSTLLLIWM